MKSFLLVAICGAVCSCASDPSRYRLEGDLFAGQVLYEQSRYEDSLAVGKDALRRAERDLGKQDPLVIESLMLVARVHLAKGDLPRALSHANQAVEQVQTRFGPESFAVGIALLNLADVQIAAARYAEAEASLKRAQNIFVARSTAAQKGSPSELEDRNADAFKAITRGKLASVYSRLGDYDRADEMMRGATAVQAIDSVVLRAASSTRAYRGERVDSHLGDVLVGLASIAAQRGDYARAKELYARAQEAWRREYGSEHPYEALVLLRLSRLHRETGELPHARSLGTQALALHERTLGMDNPRLGWSVYGLAETLREGGDHDQAEKLYVRAVALVEPAQLPRLKWQLYGGYAQLLAETGRRPAAIFYGKRSINRLQQVRSNIDAMQASLQASFVEENRGYYERLADWLIEEGRLPEAQGVLAMLKEDEYSDFIRRGKEGAREAARESVGFTVSEEEAERNYREASRGVTRLAAEVAALARRQALGQQPLDEAETKELAAKRAQLREMRGSFRERLGQVAEGLRDEGRSETLGATQLTSLRSLRRTLRELGRGTVLIHYLVTRDRLHAILTTPEIQLVRSTPIAREELYRRVEALRRRLSDPRLRDPRPEAEALFAILIEPLRADLEAAGARTLMVSLDGALRYVPLAALWDPAREHFLVEDYATVLYLEAGRHALERPSRATWTVAGMGLTREVGGFSKLPGAQVELEAIVRRGPMDSDGVLEGEIFLDEAFTADALSRSLDRRYPVVHLATHFVLKPGTDADSFLLLGDGSRLSLGEMRDRDMAFDDVELLTLSACETAVGSGGMGEEIEGFGVLAVHQGAAGVLATLWSVSDLTTAVFMPEFYAAKSGEGLTKAAALRQAQLFFLEEDIATRVRSVSSAGRQLAMRGGDGPVRAPRGYRHPYFWAPFVLLGNWL